MRDEIIWRRPAIAGDQENSMADAYISMQPGDFLVYYRGKSGKCQDGIRGIAARVAGSMGGALVQRPLAPKDDANRDWHYMIQKPMFLWGWG